MDCLKNLLERLTTVSSGIDWARLKRIIDAGRTFLITTHIRPDGDAIGSELAFAAMLEQLGKRVWIVNASRLPPRYQFLDPLGRMLEVTDPQANEARAEAEVAIVLDTSAWSQLGAMADYFANTKAKKVVIDHHVGDEDLGAELFKDESAAACGEILFGGIEPLGCQLTRAVAEPLFVAITTDTGWFRFSCTTPRSFQIAAKLTEAGVRADLLYRKLFEDFSLARLKLMARVLGSVQLAVGGRVAWSAVRRSDLAATGAASQDSEDLINYTMSLRGVEVGLMFTELKDGSVKVSFRSRDHIDCSRIAAQFGGGGHMQAAGATIGAPLDLAVQRVLRAVETTLRNIPVQAR